MVPSKNVASAEVRLEVSGLAADVVRVAAWTETPMAAKTRTPTMEMSNRAVERFMGSQGTDARRAPLDEPTDGGRQPTSGHPRPTCGRLTARARDVRAVAATSRTMLSLHRNGNRTLWC